MKLIRIQKSTYPTRIIINGKSYVVFNDLNSIINVAFDLYRSDVFVSTDKKKYKNYVCKGYVELEDENVHYHYVHYGIKVPKIHILISATICRKPLLKIFSVKNVPQKIYIYKKRI